MQGARTPTPRHPRTGCGLTGRICRRGASRHRAEAGRAALGLRRLGVQTRQIACADSAECIGITRRYTAGLLGCTRRYTVGLLSTYPLMSS